MRRARRCAVACAMLLMGVPAPAPGVDDGPGLALFEALRVTLQHNPDVAVAEQRVVASRGAVDLARARFDLQLEAGLARRRETSPGAAAASVTDSWRVSATRRLRSGLEFGPTAVLERVDEGVGTPVRGGARVDLSLLQPLRRDRGHSAAAAAERAAMNDADAQLARLEHARAEQVAAAAAAYWSYRGAYDALRIQRGAAQRAAAFLDEERRLVDAREHAPAELFPVRANLAEARANVADAERSYVRARQQLGLVMGLAWDAIETLGPPSEAWADVAQVGAPDVDALVRLAWAGRGDLRAARSAHRASEVLLAAARRALEPRLDLRLAAGYAGAATGDGVATLFTPFARSIAGANVLAELSLQLPVRNRAAGGALAQQQARERELAIALGEAQRRSASQVALTVRLLDAAWRERHDASEARGAFQVALENERAKLRNALSTTFDLLQVEARLTSADLAVTRAEERLSQALVQLRFETGTLLEPGANLPPATGRLTTIPRLP